MIPTEDVSALSSVLLVATREPSNDVTHDPLAKIHGPRSMANSSSLALVHLHLFPFPPVSKHSKWTPSAMNIRMGRKDHDTQRRVCQRKRKTPTQICRLSRED